MWELLHSFSLVLFIPTHDFLLEEKTRDGTVEHELKYANLSLHIQSKHLRERDTFAMLNLWPNSPMSEASRVW